MQQCATHICTYPRYSLRIAPVTIFSHFSEGPLFEFVLHVDHGKSQSKNEQESTLELKLSSKILFVDSLTKTMLRIHNYLQTSSTINYINIFILQSYCQPSTTSISAGYPAERRGSGAALGYVKGTRSELQQPGGCVEGRMLSLAVLG